MNIQGAGHGHRQRSTWGTIQGLKPGTPQPLQPPNSGTRTHEKLLFLSVLLHLLLHALLPLLPGELLHLILHLHQQQQRIAGSGYLLTLHIKQPFNPRTPGPGRLKTRLSFLGTRPHPALHPVTEGTPWPPVCCWLQFPRLRQSR